MPSPNFFYSYARRYEPQAYDTNTHTQTQMLFTYTHTQKWNNTSL